MADSKENYYNWDLGIEVVNRQDGFVTSAKKAQKGKNGTRFSPAGDLHLNFVYNLRIYKPLLTLIMISKGHC